MLPAPPIESDTAPPETNAEGSGPSRKHRVIANPFNDAADGCLYSDRIGIEKPFVRRPSPNRETLS
jgi:hypothetical protein